MDPQNPTFWEPKLLWGVPQTMVGWFVKKRGWGCGQTTDNRQNANQHRKKNTKKKVVEKPKNRGFVGWWVFGVPWERGFFGAQTKKSKKRNGGYRVFWGGGKGGK